MRRADLEQLYARLERPMYNVAFRWTWNEDDACDLVQEAFTRLWSMGERVVPETVEPLVWRILVHLGRSRGRKRRIWRWVALDAVRQPEVDAATVDGRLLDVERRRRAREALESLPEESRRIVVLCECSGLTYAEIGRILDLPEGTVGSRRHRALKKLRRQLQQEESDDADLVARSL